MSDQWIIALQDGSIHASETDDKTRDEARAYFAENWAQFACVLPAPTHSIDALRYAYRCAKAPKRDTLGMIHLCRPCHSKDAAMRALALWHGAWFQRGMMQGNTI